MHSITICFTGPRCQKLPWGFNENDNRCLKMKEIIKKEIEKSISLGYKVFISGMAIGFDMICAEIVLNLKEIYPKIKLFCAIACKGQEKVWNKNLQERYKNILKKADTVTYLYNYYTKDCMLNRNMFMVNNSSKVIAFYNGLGGGTKFTIDYAKKLGIDVVIIKP